LALRFLAAPIVFGENFMSDTAGIAGDRLRSFIERVERLEEDRTNLNADIREVYSEAKSAGFDAKTMRQIVRLRKLEPNERQEQEHLLEVYRNAVGI
jgi:uncharacterized protein (UPF0335 family)